MLKNRLVVPGTKVLIIGLGVSGKSALEYLLQCGADVQVADKRRFSELGQEEQALLSQSKISYQGGEHGVKLLDNIELIFVSPGVASDMSVLAEARKREIPVVGELALVGTAVTAPIVAVTGTNGKTTVTSLIGELLGGVGKKVFVGGNIGVPLFDYVLKGQGADVVVLEVSSFQLENSGEFRPDVALLLNVTPDHLDRHGSMEGYCKAKARIFANQKGDDTAIIYGDDSHCQMMATELEDRKVLLFGSGKECQARIDESGVLIHLDNSQKYDFSGSSLNTFMGRLNGAAALLALHSLGMVEDGMRQGLQRFMPPSHRMERVKEYEGVMYIDDSKATNTGAVLSALCQIQGRVFLIAGGRDKGDDYELLLPAIKKKVAHLFLLGEAADKIAEALNGAVPTSLVATMEEAVAGASKKAKAGDTVLLSPACASFDMYRSYEHRGQVFAEAVARLEGGREA